MKIQDEAILSFYDDVAPVGSKQDIRLVQHKETKKFYVRKTLSIYDAALYHALRRLKPFGIPKIFHMIEDDDRLIVIEEYISGDSLDSYLTEHGAVDASAAVDIMIQLCHILSQFHDAEPAIIHRDIKPSNIIITSSMNIVLIDFNASKQFDEGKTRDTVLMGTADYAAPEQFGFSQSDARTDIYAMGILLNVLVTGRLPKDHPCPAPLFKIVSKCTSMDPNGRYASVSHLENALTKAAAQLNRKSPKGKKERKPMRYPYLPPGFRTMTPWKMAAALLGYAFMFSLSLTMNVKGVETSAEIWLNRISSLLWLLCIPAICFDYMGVAQKLPLAKNPNIFVKTLGSCLWIFICLVVIITILVAIENAI